MTPDYIAWNDDLLPPLLHGVVANISRWTFARKWVHGHCCGNCEHRVACTCPERRKLALRRCVWCTPWLMVWGKPPPKKLVRRKATRCKQLAFGGD